MKLRSIVKKLMIPAAGICAAAPMLLSASEVTFAAVNGLSAADAVAWVRSCEGQGIDFDGSYGNQCVDLIKAYYNYLGETAPSGNAYDYAYNQLPSGWQRIQGADPRPGDILVYTGGAYGHVAICTGENESYHQNWGGSYVQMVEGDCYSTGNGYWGVIRPDFDGTDASFENVTEEESYDDNADGDEYSYEEEDSIENTAVDENEENTENADQNENDGSPENNDEDIIREDDNDGSEKRWYPDLNDHSYDRERTFPMAGIGNQRLYGFDYGFRPERASDR